MTEVELSAMRSALRNAQLKGQHLEIGTAAGGTLKELMSVYPDDIRPRFVVIDPMTYFPDQRDIVERNLRSAGFDPGKVDFRIGYSWPLLGSAPSGERFSFVLIDGDHSPKGVMQDLAWARHLETGGLLALHDYGAKFPGVMWATERFLRKNRNYEKICQAGCLVILRKRRDSSRQEVAALDLLLSSWMRYWLKFKRSVWKRVRQLGLADHAKAM